MKNNDFPTAHTFTIKQVVRITVALIGERVEKEQKIKHFLDVLVGCDSPEQIKTTTDLIGMFREDLKTIDTILKIIK